MLPARLLAAGLLILSAPPAPPASTLIVPNDNRHPAGSLANGVLTIHLEARGGAWFPEGPHGRRLDVAAWAELGKPMQNPGPLIRVPVGTEVRAMVHNALDRPLRVQGLAPMRGLRDTLVLAPGAARWVTFRATSPGTFYYIGSIGANTFDRRRSDDSQLNGAIVIDPPGVPAGVHPANDRVFVMSWWFTLDSTSPTGLGRATMAINGLSWPHTERIDLVQGDSVRWHLVNLTQSDHPMHLHGFYFRVDEKSDMGGTTDTIYAPADRRMAVTEVISPAQTMTLAWSPQRAGNWIFHCHYQSHVSNLVSLDDDRGDYDAHAALAHPASYPPDMHMSGTAGPPHQMFGLVLGIHVAPAPNAVAARPDLRPERAVRVLVRERPNVYGTTPGYAFVFAGSADDRSGALPIPARPLVLTRGARVAITIVNRAAEPTTIHWHGIELESYPDGVPGWSGSGTKIMPAIAPGDSLTVHWTPPRAGTFMYHSHFDERQQISSGLYGPILVLERGQRFDPETDRVFFIGNAGPTRNVIRGPYAALLLNGREAPPPIELHAGVSYRFRFLNLSDDFPTTIALYQNGHPVTWRAIAKDGADLPPKQATNRPAVLLFDPGETYDFRFTPRKAGALTLTFNHLNFPGGPTFVPESVAVRVRR
ncbi:MAG TPA: multicopper oxidase domain-containing protein [Gemmatimonadaceae bacterium]